MNENKNQGYKKSYCNYVAFIEMVTMAIINSTYQELPIKLIPLFLNSFLLFQSCFLLFWFFII